MGLLNCGYKSKLSFNTEQYKEEEREEEYVNVHEYYVILYIHF